MKINAYAKINLILNVLGKRPDGYHEVEMLMQAISLCDVVDVEFDEPAEPNSAPGDRDHINAAASAVLSAKEYHVLSPAKTRVLSPADFEYGCSDLAYRAAVLMAETFRPDLICTALDKGGLEPAPGVKGVSISIEKNIPAAAGLAGGSADAAAVITGLARLWGLGPTHKSNTTDGPDAPSERKPDNPTERAADNKALFALLSPLGAKLGSDIPFCIAAQLGFPTAIARGRGTELEFVQPSDCGVDLYFSEQSIPNKTAAVYRELRPEDCAPRYDISAFLAAKTIREKRSLMGNHLQTPAERLLVKSAAFPEGAILCGAGPTYFTIGETGLFRTIV